jgi:hypothetical protein
MKWIIVFILKIGYDNTLRLVIYECFPVIEDCLVCFTHYFYKNLYFENYESKY